MSDANTIDAVTNNNNNNKKKRKSCEEPAPSETIAKVHAAIVHYFSSRYKNVDAPADASGPDKVDSVSNSHVQVIFNSLFIAEEAYEDIDGHVAPYPRLVKVFNIPTSALYKFHAWFLDFAMGTQSHPQVKKLLKLFFSGWGCLDRTVSPTENKKLQAKIQKLFAKLNKGDKVSDFSINDLNAYVVGFNKYFAEHQLLMEHMSSPLSIKIEKVYVFLRGNRYE